MQTLDRIFDKARRALRGEPETKTLTWGDDFPLQVLEGGSIDRNWPLLRDVKELYALLPQGSKVEVEMEAGDQLFDLMSEPRHGGTERIYGMRLTMDGNSAYMSWHQDSWGSRFEFSHTMKGPPFVRFHCNVDADAAPSFPRVKWLERGDKTPVAPFDGVRRAFAQYGFKAAPVASPDIH